MSADERRETRAAVERGRYLVRATDLRDIHALALAYRELGYSASGIASEIGSSEGSIRTWLDKIAVRYGIDSIETKWEEQRTGPLTEPSTDSIRESLSPPVIADYLALAQQYPEEIPESVDPYALENVVSEYVWTVRDGRKTAPRYTSVDQLAEIVDGWYE